MNVDDGRVAELTELWLNKGSVRYIFEIIVDDVRKTIKREK